MLAEIPPPAGENAGVRDDAVDNRREFKAGSGIDIHEGPPSRTNRGKGGATANDCSGCGTSSRFGGSRISEPNAVDNPDASWECLAGAHDAGGAVGILRLRLIIALWRAKINPRSG